MIPDWELWGKSLIEREASIKRIKEYASNAYGIDLDDSKQFSGSSLPEKYCEGLYEAIELIDDIPAIDPVRAEGRIVHGKWICDNSDSLYKYHCSVCKKEGHSRFDRYCSNCGARMASEGGDEG